MYVMHIGQGQKSVFVESAKINVLQIEINQTNKCCTTNLRMLNLNILTISIEQVLAKAGRFSERLLAVLQLKSMP